MKRENSSPVMLRRVEYLQSLRGTITTNYREMSEKEVALEEQVRAMCVVFTSDLSSGLHPLCIYRLS